MIGRLTGLFVYPVKGARGTAMSRWDIDACGLRYDRRWLLIDDDGVAITQREHARLALLRPALEPERLVLRADGMPDLIADQFPHQQFPRQQFPRTALHGGHAAAQSRPRRTVQIWGDVVAAEDVGEEAARWVSRFLGVSSRVVFMPDDVIRPVSLRYGQPGDQVGFADAYPFLLISQAALDELNRRLDRPLPMNRFRPNLVVAGVPPHAEDGWARIRIGEVLLDVVKPCARCVVTTTDQETGERGHEPLRTLATYRRSDGNVHFGQNLIHRTRGELAVGDPVEVLAHR